MSGFGGEFAIECDAINDGSGFEAVVGAYGNQGRFGSNPVYCTAKCPAFRTKSKAVVRVTRNLTCSQIDKPKSGH